MKRSFLFSLILAVLVISLLPDLFAQEFQDWKYTHPLPQANNLSQIKMIDANTWVTTGENGTFMKTTNAGVNWFVQCQTGVPDAAGTIGGNANLWFFNSMNGYVTGMAGYIGKTTDGGVTFNQVGAGIIPTNEWGQGIWFANQDTGFVTTRQGSWVNGRIVRTTNGGATWTSLLTYSQGITAIWGTNSQTVYAVAVDGTIFKTTNCGQTWSQNVGVAPQYMYDMSFLNQTTGFVAGSQGGIARTTNSGNTWIPLTSPQVDWAYFQIKIVSATEIYLVGDPVNLYKSTDLGNSWQTLQIVPVNGPASTFIWYSLDKAGSTLTMCGDFGIVAKSTDNGLTWFSNNFLLNTNILFDMALAPGTNNLFAVGRQYLVGTRQIFYSSNYGNNWSTQDLGVDMDASSISMVTAQIGYISGTNGNVMKTTNGGSNWLSVTSPTSGSLDIYTIDFVNPTTGWAFVNYIAISGGNIFKTTDGGQSWTQQGGNITYSISSADMVDVNVGYATINSSGQPIYKTTDGGSNWFSVTTPLNGMIRTVKAIDGNTVYIGASSGTTRMAKTTNGGTNWTPVALPVPIDINSIDFVDADTGYVSGNTTTVVCRTTNGGSNWTFENLHLPTLVGVKVLQNDIAYAMGTYGSILRNDIHGFVPVELISFNSSVSGNNVLLKWSTATELNNQGFDIEKSTDQNHYVKIGFIAGSGTTTETRSYSYIDNDLDPGIYNYRLKQVDYDGSFEYSDVIQVEITVPFDFALEQNYPNPFNPSTSIRYSVPQNSMVNIKVYNLIGQEVAELVNDTKSAGQYEINFESNGLASGIYLVKMQAGNFTSTIKMTLLK